MYSMSNLVGVLNHVQADPRSLIELNFLRVKIKMNWAEKQFRPILPVLELERWTETSNDETKDIA